MNKSGRVGWVGHENHREGGVGQLYLQDGVGWGVENVTE